MPPALQITGHRSELAWWEMVRRDPHPALRPVVLGAYCGWIEHALHPFRRRELPSTRVPLILNLGDPYRVLTPSDPGDAGTPLGSFVAGLWDTYAVTASPRSSVAIQVDLTPLGAHRLLGAPMHALTNRAVELRDLLGTIADTLVARLHDAHDWQSRFELLDRELLARLRATEGIGGEIAHAWHRLATTHGLLPIGALAAEMGWSRKHLVARFRAQVGLPPKTVARILRFDRALHRLRTCDAWRWTELALECGYYDQSHLIRDFADFTGTTPTQLLGRRLPGLEGISD